MSDGVGSNTKSGSKRLFEDPTIIAALIGVGGIIIAALIGLWDSEPSVPVATPSPIPTIETPTFRDSNYVLDEELPIGNFIIRRWTPKIASEPGPVDYVTIAVANQPSVVVAEIDYVLKLEARAGNDITGEGTTDIVIERFTGGAHCCWSTVVYNLSSPLTKVLDSPESNCIGKFEDLASDGVYEFITCDDVFAYDYCSYAESPKPIVVLKYDSAKQRYVPATPEFAYVYGSDIYAHTKYAEEVVGSLPPDQKKCPVLQVVLDHLYTGNAETAWAEFHRLYTEPDVEQFRNEIEIQVDSSSLYVTPLELELGQ